MDRCPRTLVTNKGRPQISKKSIKEHGNIVIGDIVEGVKKVRRKLRMVYKKVDPETLVRKRDSTKFF